VTHGERGFPVGRLLRRATLVAAGILGVGLAIVSVVVQTEGDYVLEDLGGDGPGRALVLYHPSRDARFSDDLSLAVAEGLQEVGLSVHRATVTSGTPRQPQGYTMIVVVANTYYWTPDRPTRRYLARARLGGTPVLGLMAGAGSTGRAERVLAEALRETGAEVIATRSFWLWRPNDENRTDEPNRGVALQLATRLGAEVGAAVLAEGR
jgi:hypothetical protein